MLQQSPEINAADTVWMLVASGLVLLMTPALAFFYGGLVRAKNALNTMMMSVASLGVVGLVWALVGYSFAFAGGSDAVGGFAYLALAGVDLTAKGTIPHLLFMIYQGTFAIITAALISGAVVERMRFGPYLAFIALWVVVVYAPTAHWVWGGGWLGRLGVLDYAGGTVVHVNAAAAAFTAALALRPRRDYGRQALLPHNVPYVLLGAALLWFGWFGFNAGSALAASSAAVLAFANTFLAPAATLVVWMIIDLVRTGRATAVGAATGIVVGLVAVTPAAGFVSPLGAIAIGALAAPASYFAILWRSRTPLDDALDVVAAHGIGGATGALLTGVFAHPAWGGVSGLIAGNGRQVGLQLLGLAAVALYSGVVTLGLIKVVNAIAHVRSDQRGEAIGLDITQHGEEAYTRGEGAVLVIPTATAGGGFIASGEPAMRPMAEVAS
jgi:Amt family ammonium transporter